MSVGNEIGDLLLDIGLITPEELATAHGEQAKSGERLTLVLERLGLVSYHQLKDSLELQFGVNFYSLSKSPPPIDVADLLKLDTKLKHRVVPVSSAGTQYSIAMVNPDDLIALDSVRVELKSGHLKKVVCTADEFEHYMREAYNVNMDGSPAQAEVAAPVAPETPPTPAAAPVSPPKPAVKVPAKGHLASLFGDDDDDDDDDDDIPLPVPKTAASMGAKVEPKVEPKAEPIAEPIAETIAEPEPVEIPVPEPEVAVPPAPEVKAEPEIKPEPPAIIDIPAPTASGRKPAASVTSHSLPALTPDILLSPMTPPSVTQKIAVPSNGHPPTPVALTPEMDLTATGDHLPVDIEDMVAGVASHLAESTETTQSLNNNASRQLLEDVVESELGGMEETEIDRLKEQQNSSIMLLAHEIIGKATQKRCSDIHLEPDSSGVTLRYFLHGELLADCVLPGEIHGALVSSYKIIAGLDPNELEKPQDKKITTKVEDDQVELRITTLPSDHGEMVAISMRFV